MSKKSRRKQQRKQGLDGIQIAGIGLLVVVIAAIFWMIYSNRNPASGGPPMTIDVNKQYFATFKMEKGGEFVVQLFADKAPVTVNNFVFLAREGFYDGTTFHRVIDGFMAQGGDPEGNGTGGPGYSFEDEFSEDLTFDRAGLLAMANSGPDTNGSQFFITYGPTPHLNGLHTIFGEVVEGMDVVNGLKRGSPQEVPGFQGDVIESVTITEE